MHVFDRAGRSLTLSPAFSVGGEGSIHRVTGSGSVVAKIYHPGRVGSELTEKLRVMVENPPEDPTWSVRKHHSIAWVSQLIYRDSSARSLAGFLMPALDTDLFKQAHTYFDTRDRIKRFGGSFTWKHLMITASNIAGAVAAVHDRGHRVGDLRDTNVLVSPNALCSLIDCDSFHIVDPRAGRVFPTRVGTSEFLPPELQAADFRNLSVDRYESDLFALAVLVFKIVMLGTHPFQARGPAVADMPSTEAKILAGTYPHEGRKGLKPPEFSPPIDVLPPSIRALAAACFVKGHKRPKARPAAEEWAEALRHEVFAIKSCKTNPHHLFGGHLRGCPWCRFARSKPDPFPPRLNMGGQTATSIASGPEDVAARKRRLAAHVATALSDGPLSPLENEHIMKLGAELALSNAEMKSVIRECERLAARSVAPQARRQTAVATLKPAPAPQGQASNRTRSLAELKRLLERGPEEVAHKQPFLAYLSITSLAATLGAGSWLLPLAIPIAVVLLVIPVTALFGGRRDSSQGWADLVPRLLQNVTQSLYFFVPLAWWFGLPVAALVVILLFAEGPTGLVIRALATCLSLGFASWMLVRKRTEPFLQSLGRGWARIGIWMIAPRYRGIRAVYVVAAIAAALGYLAFTSGPLWWPLEAEPFS